MPNSQETAGVGKAFNYSTYDTYVRSKYCARDGRIAREIGTKAEQLLSDSTKPLEVFLLLLLLVVALLYMSFLKIKEEVIHFKAHIFSKEEE